MEFTAYYIRHVNRESVGELRVSLRDLSFYQRGAYIGRKTTRIDIYKYIYIDRYIYRNAVLKQNQEKEGRKKC